MRNFLFGFVVFVVMLASLPVRALEPSVEYTNGSFGPEAILTLETEKSVSCDVLISSKDGSKINAIPVSFDKGQKQESILLYLGARILMIGCEETRT